MMKTRPPIQKSQTYDNLLAEYLPVIRRAACSLTCQEKSNNMETLLWAGFQGLKDAFDEFPGEAINLERNYILKMIHSSMLQLFREN